MQAIVLILVLTLLCKMEVLVLDGIFMQANVFAISVKPMHQEKVARNAHLQKLDICSAIYGNEVTAL